MSRSTIIALLAAAAALLAAGCSSAPPAPLGVAADREFVAAAPIALPDPLALPAPEPAAAPEPADAEEAPKVWSGLFEAGATATGGNTRTRDFDAKAEVKADWGADRFMAFVRSEWGTAQDADTGGQKRNRNRHTAGAKYEHDFSERFFGFGQQDFERDEFQDLKLRSTTAVGAGYKVLDEEKHKLNTRAGAGWESNDYFVDENSSNLVGTLGEDWTWDINEGWDFVETFSLISNLREIDNDFRTVTTADLRHTLTSNLYLSFGVEHRYNAQPARDDDNVRVNRQDWKAMIKLGWTF